MATIYAKYGEAVVPFDSATTLREIKNAMAVHYQELANSEPYVNTDTGKVEFRITGGSKGQI